MTRIKLVFKELSLTSKVATCHNVEDDEIIPFDQAVNEIEKDRNDL